MHIALKKIFQNIHFVDKYTAYRQNSIVHN